MNLSKRILNLCNTWAQLNGLKYLATANPSVDIILVLISGGKINKPINM